MRTLEGIANVASIIVFLWLMIGAGINFIPHPSARRDIRSRFIIISFWLMVIVASRAPLAPVWLVSVGLAGFAASLVLFNWASYSIRSREFSYVFSTDVPQFLHTAGPYVYVRNQFYSSYLLALVSAALIHSNVLTGAIARCGPNTPRTNRARVVSCRSDLRPPTNTDVRACCRMVCMHFGACLPSVPCHASPRRPERVVEITQTCRTTKCRDSQEASWDVPS